MLILPLKHSAVGMPIIQAALYSRIRDSSGGMVTRLWAGSPRNRDSILGKDKRFIHQIVQTGSGVHVSSCLMMPGSLSVGVKQPGREPDHRYLPS